MLEWGIISNSSNTTITIPCSYNNKFVICVQKTSAYSDNQTANSSAVMATLNTFTFRTTSAEKNSTYITVGF